MPANDRTQHGAFRDPANARRRLISLLLADCDLPDTLVRYLKDRKDKKSRQIVFDGEALKMQAVWTVRDEFFPPGRGKGR